MILKARYGGLDKAGESTDFNPYFGTDVGICSIVKVRNIWGFFSSHSLKTREKYISFLS